MHGHILAATGASKLIITWYCYANLHLGSGQAKARYLTCTYLYLLPWLTIDRFLPCADVTLEKERRDFHAQPPSH